MATSWARQFFKGILKKEKVYPYTIAPLVKTKNGSNIEKDVGQLSNPNLLINGDFQVWQRGSTFDVDVTKYTADRWVGYLDADKGYKPYTITNNYKRLCIVPPNGGGKYLVYQHVELNNAFIRKITGKTLTLSVKVLSSVAHMISISTYILYNSSNKPYFMLGSKQQSCIAGQYTILDLTFTIPSDADFDDAKSLQIIIGSGTTTVPVYFDYAKLEFGSLITPFVPKTFAEEILDCKRYFENINVNHSGYFNTTSSSEQYKYLFFVNKRIAPTVTRTSTGQITNVKNVIVNVSTIRFVLTFRPNVVGQFLYYDCIYDLDSEIY